MANKTLLISHHPPFIPICRHLAQQGWRFLCLNPEFAKTLADLDLPVKHLGEYTGGLQDRAFSEASRLITAAPLSLHRNGLGPEAMGFIGQMLPAFLYPRLGDLILLILSLDRAKPDAILLHNDVEPLTRTAALWGKARSIPTLHVPHSVYIDVNRGGIGTDIHDMITASFLAAAGPYQRQWYEARSKEVKVRETGLPQFDRWATMEFDRERARRKILSRFDPGKPIVVYASTWPQITNALGASDGWAYTYIEFLKAAKNLDLQILVKLHPRSVEDSHRWHAQQMAKLGISGYLTAMTDYNPLVLAAADLLVVYGGSNLILEGSHVPSLRLMTTAGYETDAEIGQIGAGVSEMTTAIGDWLYRPAANTTRLRQKYLGVGDGKASERIGDWIEELC